MYKIYFGGDNKKRSLFDQFNRALTSAVRTIQLEAANLEWPQMNTIWPGGTRRKGGKARQLGD